MKVFIYLIAIILSCNTIFAGTTGKIAGRVVDSETGEKLVGVSIIIEGSKQGAVTDLEGEYYILNVPPGMHTLKASMIGYNTRVIEKVRVQVDLTTKIDIELKQTATVLSQDIVVTAKKEIQKDLTSSERSIQSDQIEALPVRDISSLLSMQAGIVRDAGGGLHIRGGRTSEISYMVDGILVMNPVNRSQGIGIDDQSIEELKAITGTFNAEYGSALSGVVNIVTKKGSDRFTANATGYIGDYFSTDDNLYYVMDNEAWAHASANALINKYGLMNFDFGQYGIHSWTDLNKALQSSNLPWEPKKAYLNNYNPLKRYDLQVNLSGPIPGTGNTISYFAAGRTQYQPGAQYGKRYFMPWGIWQPVMDTLHSFEMPDGKLVPLYWDNSYSGQAKLFFNFNQVSFSYGIYYNYDHNYGGGSKYVPDGGSHNYYDVMTHIGSMTFVFSNSTYLDLKGSYYSAQGKGYLYEDPYDYRYMPTNPGDFQQYVFKPAQGSDLIVQNNTNDFAYYGNNVNRYANHTKYLTYSADLTSQIDKYNLIKMGTTGRFHDLDQEGYELQFSQVTYRPIIPDITSPFHSYYAAKPKEFAAYIQDKIEFDELIINFGVRYDYFNSDGRVLADPKDPQIYSPFLKAHIYKNYNPALKDEDQTPYTLAEKQAFWYKKTTPKSQISPRFGVSFPITAEGVIHFSYGHFFQNPEFQYLYTNPNFWVSGAGSTPLVGNADLNAERTVMYELGLQQQLFNNLNVNVTGFYRDIRDYVGSGFPIDTYLGQTYYSYVNRDHAVARGITLSLSYGINDLSMKFDYTYMNASGTASNPIDAYNNISAKRAPVVQLINLNWDQPHVANVIINYVKETWAATLTGQLNSGFPYTPSFPRGESQGAGSFIGLATNSERMPTSVNFDLRLSKTFHLPGVQVQAMLDVINLLDTRNARSVYSDTGVPDFTLQDPTVGGRIPEISTTKEYFTNPGYYSNPRFISLGFRLSYN